MTRGGMGTQDTLAGDVHDLVVVGSGGVGKSCLTVRFLKNEFSNDYDPTIEENYRKCINVDGGGCVVNIIDTAGQHEYTSLRDQHLKAGGGFLLVFALNDKASFEEVKQLREQIVKLKDTKRVPIVICANKCDLPEDMIEVDEESVKGYTTPLKIPYLLTSAKEDINVEESFHELVREARKMEKKPGGGATSKEKLNGVGAKDEAASGCKCVIL